MRDFSRLFYGPIQGYSTFTFLEIHHFISELLHRQHLCSAKGKRTHCVSLEFPFWNKMGKKKKDEETIDAVYLSDKFGSVNTSKIVKKKKKNLERSDRKSNTTQYSEKDFETCPIGIGLNGQTATQELLGKIWLMTCTAPGHF